MATPRARAWRDSASKAQYAMDNHPAAGAVMARRRTDGSRWRADGSRWRAIRAVLIAWFVIITIMAGRRDDTVSPHGRAAAAVITDISFLVDGSAAGMIAAHIYVALMMMMPSTMVRAGIGGWCGEDHGKRRGEQGGCQFFHNSRTTGFADYDGVHELLFDGHGIFLHAGGCFNNRACRRRC